MKFYATLQVNNIGLIIYLNNFQPTILVMPIFDTTLWDMLKTSSNSTLTTKMRIMILCKVIDGLIYIQAHKLVHLDIKPANIMLKLKNNQWDGQTVVITDFGLCSPYKTLSGTAGTPGYGAPEQFIGRPSQTSDNYAVGKLGLMVMFPWQLAWNLLTQPLKKGEISNIEKNPNLRQYHQIISQLLNVRI